MKFTKKNVLIVALAVCLLAVISMGTLAWFTDSDEVTNEFLIADSDDTADGIFSVDVWEKDKDDKVYGVGDDDTGIEYPDVLPGDELVKKVYIENTGYYDQYIRATVTVGGASVWQKVYGQRLVPLSAFVDTINNDAIHTMVSYYNYIGDSFVYEIYYKDTIAAGEEILVFDTVKISEDLTREQAADLFLNSFFIDVFADAVQTENVGDNVYDAFRTVGLINAVHVSDAKALADVLASDAVEYVIIDAAALTNNTLTIDSAITDKTLDFAGQDVAVVFSANATAEDVIITGIVDADGQGYSVTTNSGFSGDVTIIDCVFYDDAGKGCVSPIAGDVTIYDCEFYGGANAGKSYGVRANGRTGDLEIVDCSFVGFASWAININGANDGDLTVSDCYFESDDGVLKTLGGGVTGDFTFIDNEMNCAGHDGKIDQLVVSGSKNGPVICAGTKTVSGNTNYGEAWTQD